MRSFAVPVLVICLLTIEYSYADSNTPGKVIAGWVERIRFPEMSIAVKAKLDSGAKTSSIHAENIKRFKKGQEKWLRFDLVFNKHANTDEPSRKQIEAPQARRAVIKEHNGKHQSRPAVMLPICFDGRRYDVEFTLADRSEYIYSVLLGRRFLHDKAVIDPGETFLIATSCDASHTPKHE